MKVPEKENKAILPVGRSRKEARHLYNRISQLYDCIAGIFEHKYTRMALEQLAIKKGEKALEIGFGSGYTLKIIAEKVSNGGQAYGADIAHGMLEVARRRLKKAGLINQATLCLGEGTKLPYRNSIFDAVFLSFTLELFDTPEIPKVLSETKRVLKPNGRFGVISLSKSYREPITLRLYEWAHKKWPKYIDCRPIYVEASLKEAGYDTQWRQEAKLLGIPLEIIIATKVQKPGV